MARRNLTATMDNGDTVTVDTIAEARKWAASHGKTANRCTIYSGLRVVAQHRRSTEGDGSRWYKAYVGQEAADGV